MGFLSKLGRLDPLGSKLHKADPLGKYDLVGSAIYGGGAAPAAGVGGMPYSVSEWSPEMQALHDYYAKSTEQGGLGLSGQQAVGWNPGMLTAGQRLDQFSGAPVSSGPSQGQSYGQPTPMGWRDSQIPAMNQSGARRPYGDFGTYGGYDFGESNGYRSSMYPSVWGQGQRR